MAAKRRRATASTTVPQVGTVPARADFRPPTSSQAFGMGDGAQFRVVRVPCPSALHVPVDADEDGELESEDPSATDEEE